MVTPGFPAAMDVDDAGFRDGAGYNVMMTQIFEDKLMASHATR
jgi:hypothetical protein